MIRTMLISTIFIFCLTQNVVLASGISINNDGAISNNNAMLDVQSPTDGDGKGMFVPRITEEQRTSSDASLPGGLLNDNGELRGGNGQGLLIYQTNGASEGFYYNKSTTATPEWIYIGLENNTVLNEHIDSVAASKITDVIPVSHGGTGADTADSAKSNLGLGDVNIVSNGEDSRIWLGPVNETYSGVNNINIGAGTRTSLSSYNGVSGIAGIAVGKNAVARYVRGGDECPYSNNGIAIGTDSDGDYGGIAIGYDADGQYRNMAIGHKASAYSGYNRIAIGNGVVNRHNNSISLRGTLFLEDAVEKTINGQTGRIFYRSLGDPDGTTTQFGSNEGWVAKAFTIDHPLDPENKVLRHYCLEGPDVLNIYTGNVNIRDGIAIVKLPDYYSKLNFSGSEIYSLTAIGGPAMIWIDKEVNENKFAIASDNDIKVSWTIKVKRNDEALINDLKNRPVEQLKSEMKSGQMNRENLMINTFNVN